MKKSLIALATLAAAGASFAQSSVSITGMIDMGYQNVNAQTATSSSGKIAQNGTATSALSFNGTEDLGGNTKANFQIEFNPDLVGGTGFSGVNAVSGAATGAMGQVFLGLSSATAGQVKLGRVNTPALSAFLTGSVFGTALGSGYSAGQNIYSAAAAGTLHTQTYPTRFNNAVEYTTPSFSGVTGRLYYVAKNDKDTGTDSVKNNAGVTDLGLAYNNGPLNVAFSSQTLKAGVNQLGVGATQYNSTGDNKTVLFGQDQPLGYSNSKLVQNTLAANYNFGAATVYGSLWNTKESATHSDCGCTEVSAKRSGSMIGAKYAVSSAVDLMASYAKVSDKMSAADYTAADRSGMLPTDAKIFGLGADYKLSARTAVYARYADLNPNTGGTNKGSKTTAVGVRHAF